MQYIPTSTDPSQQFTTSLGGTNYRLKLDYNGRGQTWAISVYQIDGTLLVAGQRLALGTRTLEGLNLGIGYFILIDSEDSGVDPGETELGTRVGLYHVTQDEVENGIS